MTEGPNEQTWPLKHSNDQNEQMNKKKNIPLPNNIPLTVFLQPILALQTKTLKVSCVIIRAIQNMAQSCYQKANTKYGLDNLYSHLQLAKQRCYKLT